MRQFYILSIAHSKQAERLLTWWRPNDADYCFRLTEAGKYSEERVTSLRSYYDNGESTKAIPCEVVDALAEPVSGVESRAIERTKPETDPVVRYKHGRILRAWKDKGAKKS